jgi:hypothetical protein
MDIIRTAGTGVSAIDQFSASAPPQMKMAMYREEFLRARQAIRHGFVLTTKGTCLPLALTIPNPQVASEADVPADIDKIFSPRLPDELYLYMCKGIISPTVLGWLTTGNVYEPLPLADSLEYQRYVQKMITENEASPRVLSLAILLDALHPQWKQRRVVGSTIVSFRAELMYRTHTTISSRFTTISTDSQSCSIAPRPPSLFNN